MTVKTTLSFTERHHAYLRERVGQGIYASTSAAVAAAVEQMMEDEAAREAALVAMSGEIRRRMATPAEDYLDHEEAFGGPSGEPRRE